jgi:hypothetical protein
MSGLPGRGKLLPDSLYVSRQGLLTPDRASACQAAKRDRARSHAGRQRRSKVWKPEDGFTWRCGHQTLKPCFEGGFCYVPHRIEPVFGAEDRDRVAWHYGHPTSTLISKSDNPIFRRRQGLKLPWQAGPTKPLRYATIPAFFGGSLLR